MNDQRSKDRDFTKMREIQASIIAQVCLGIADLHDRYKGKKKHMHRDIKPMNILLFHLESGDVQAKLADFEASKEVRSLTVNSRQGTRPYMAPDIYRVLASGEGYPYKEAIDVWSLGVTIYQLYTGRVPFDFKEFQCKQISQESEPYLESETPSDHQYS